jgi:hypothetical protein
MSRQRTNPPDGHSHARLTVSREQLEREIEVQIDRGRELVACSINTREELEASRRAGEASAGRY